MRRNLGAAAPAELLTHLQRLREELEIPADFSPAALAEAEVVAARVIEAPERSDLRLVTIDPPGSMDLDQALALTRTDSGMRLHYAIAAVGRFVEPGGKLDQEITERAVTVYGPGHSFPLHPRVLSAGAASLLPGEERPAFLFTIDLDRECQPTNTTVELATVISRARLTYEEVQSALDGETPLPADVPADLPQLLEEFGLARIAVEEARGGASLDTPEQEIIRTDRGFELTFRTTLDVENYNAQVSLLTGMEAARLMREAGTGVFRTLPPADPRDIKRLRRTAHALGFNWRRDMDYPDFLRSLPHTPSAAAFRDQATTLFRGAGYLSFTDGAPSEPRTHGAIAAEYAHVTAPLRRLVDRYGLEVCLAVSTGEEIPEHVLEGLENLPEVMADGSRRAGSYERGALGIMEALVLQDHVGETFRGVVIDEDDRKPKNGKRRGSIMLAEPAVEAPVHGVEIPLGEEVEARLTQADPETGTVSFELV